MKCNVEDFIIKRPIDLTHIGGGIEEMSHIEVRRKNIAGLRKPYEYIAPAERTKKFIKVMRDIVKAYNINVNKPWPFRSEGSITQKALSRGTNLTIFLMPKSGITETEWESTADKIQAELFEFLGTDAKLFYIPLNFKEKGFDTQIRWHGYIMYEEMKNL
jgi:hypothetical protein